MKTALTVFAAFCLLATPLVAADGVLIVEKSTTGGVTKTNQVQIDKTRMRAESEGPNGGKQIFVFDGGAQVMRIIDTEKKTYSEITKADADRMGEQMNSMMAQMQEQMKNLPPAQRAQMEAMMKGRGMAMSGMTKTEYKKAGTDKVGNWTCDKYDGFQNGQKTSELCTVDPKTLGFSVADFQVSQQLADFFQKMMPQNSDQIFSLGRNDPAGFSGVPVRRSYTILGMQTVSELTQVSRQTFADSLFAVPAGFTKQPLPFGR